ncbi:MAG: DUF6056 family protein [Anaerolineales bacterium]|jgi:hypothetical protein
MEKPSLYGRIPQIISFLLVLLFIGLLSIYGIKGTYSRYAQDDYCYGYKVRALGFWNMQIQSYLHRNEFNSDRYSLTITHSLVELLGGPKAVPILPSLEMIVWFAGLVYVFYQLQQVIYSKTDYLIAIVSALVIIFFTLYLALNQYQILFWLSGMQTYLSPIVLATFLFGFLISIARMPKFIFPYAIGLGFLSFFAGGFSETTGLWQFACWSMILVWAIIFRKRSILARNAIRPALILIGSVALSLVIMAICPGNFKAAYYPDFITLILQSLSYGVGFIWTALKGTPLPYLAITLMGFFVSFTNRSKSKLKIKFLSAEISAMILILYGLSVVVMLPSMYATSHYPGDRALLPAQFTLSACLFIIGWKLAEVLSVLQPNAFPYRTSIIFQGLLGLTLCVYIVHIIPHVYDKLPAYQGRAQAWDLRQELILKEKASGIENVIAPAFDSIYGITELHYEANNWVNECAAKYYGVQTISTIDNYAGISTHPIGK